MTDPDTRAAREALVADWIAAWNAHDLDRIVAHYADPLTFVSPLVVERLGRADGTITRRDELRAYFAMGLKARPDLRFEPVAVLHGVGSTTSIYRGAGGRLVAETFVLDAGGKVVAANVAYGDAAAGARFIPG